MDPLLILLLGVAIGIVTGVTWSVGVAYIFGDKLIHRIRYKEYVLPCPACRDEETDEPTGRIKPKNEWLQREFGEGVFDCSTCDGTKRIVYEFPRHERPDINDRQILEGPAPGQAKPKKGWLH